MEQLKKPFKTCQWIHCQILLNSNFYEFNSSFLDEAERLGKDNYVPNNDDILKLRIVTQNITETIFHIQKINFHFFDVSGLKYHRKYWLPYFDKVTSILFVVSLSAYNQMMIEEGTTNRMTDAIFVFKTIANHPQLSSPSIILFLNKKDLYEQKIKKYLIKDYFPDYDGIWKEIFNLFF